MCRFSDLQRTQSIVKGDCKSMEWKELYMQCTVWITSSIQVKAAINRSDLEAEVNSHQQQLVGRGSDGNSSGELRSVQPWFSSLALPCSRERQWVTSWGPSLPLFLWFQKLHVNSSGWTQKAIRRKIMAVTRPFIAHILLFVSLTTAKIK